MTEQQQTAVEHIADVRTRLTETRIALRNAQVGIAPARAKAEARIVAAAGDEKALGANEAARKRAIEIGLESDAEYQGTIAALRALEETETRLGTELENALERRRAEEWAIRERTAVALERFAATRPQRDSQPEEYTDEVMPAAVADVAAGAEPTYNDQLFSDDPNPF